MVVIKILYRLLFLLTLKFWVWRWIVSTLRISIFDCIQILSAIKCQNR